MNDHSGSETVKPVIRPPVLPEMPADLDLSQAARSALRQCEDIEGARFSGGEAVGLSGGNLEFSGCLFERCSFADWDLKRVAFVDCVFDRCDFSALRLDNATFQRVRFASCRFTGAEFLRTVLTNAAFEDVSADYFALSEGKCAHVLFQACRFRESLWRSVKLGDAAFSECDLTSSQFIDTPLDGLDMTTCELSALHIDPRDLRGLKVTPSQGLLFCSLLGLVIKDGV